MEKPPTPQEIHEAALAQARANLAKKVYGPLDKRNHQPNLLAAAIIEHVERAQGTIAVGQVVAKPESPDSKV